MLSSSPLAFLTSCNIYLNGILRVLAMVIISLRVNKCRLSSLCLKITQSKPQSSLMVFAGMISKISGNRILSDSINAFILAYSASVFIRYD